MLLHFGGQTWDSKGYTEHVVGLHLVTKPVDAPQQQGLAVNTNQACVVTCTVWNRVVAHSEPSLGSSLVASSAAETPVACKTRTTLVHCQDAPSMATGCEMVGTVKAYWYKPRWSPALLGGGGGGDGGAGRDGGRGGRAGSGGAGGGLGEDCGMSESQLEGHIRTQPTGSILRLGAQYHHDLPGICQVTRS